jgi:hypothetical protein
MTRSPLAYPLNRGADMDVGGAADLQTDVMRFMAILSLCLVAIFALVQSMPITPPAIAPPVSSPDPVVEAAPEPEPVAEPVVEAVPEPKPMRPVETVSLTRPKWVPKYEPKAPPIAAAEPAAEPAVEPAVATEEVEGFTLRFESDSALSRLVASSKVGVYAIDGERARRMTVSESRISFWDASLPSSFHEMEVSTVPTPVVDALARTGIDTGSISWGVTLPGKLKTQLEELLQEHRGGSLVIGSNGNIRLEAS